jgi:hypothetical protein
MNRCKIKSAIHSKLLIKNVLADRIEVMAARYGRPYRQKWRSAYSGTTSKGDARLGAPARAFEDES